MLRIAEYSGKETGESMAIQPTPAYPGKLPRSTEKMKICFVNFVCCINY
jgi:hypothetical protein